MHIAFLYIFSIHLFKQFLGYIILTVMGTFATADDKWAWSSKDDDRSDSHDRLGRREYKNEHLEDLE